MQWCKCTSPRLRDASTSIKALLDSPYFSYMNNPKTAEIYQALVDLPIEGETNSKPQGQLPKDPCMSTLGQRLGAQQLSSVRYASPRSRPI